jgi:hypothetical protein
MTPEQIAELEPKDYPLERFSPRGAHVGMALALIVAGFAAAQGVARVGLSES